MKRGNSGLSSANASVWLDDSDEDARGERLALTDDLRERLQKAELLTEEYRKQFEIMQMRLDEALKAQTELEERVHEEEETADSLVNENKEVLRQRRELESLHEAERAATMKERDELLAREEEQRQIIQRLKDALDRKEIKLSESIELDSGGFMIFN